MDDASPEPLYRLIRNIRKPASLREIMATCLRSIYTKNPFSDGDGMLPAVPQELLEHVIVNREIIGGISCSVYRPVDTSERMPLIVYMHGGGFVIGCSEDTDYVTRTLCHVNRAIVVSINYRLAPETIFPGQLNDCLAVLCALDDSVEQFRFSPENLFLAGDSAGGNLAVSLSCMLHQRNISIKGLVLLAPWLDMQVENYDSFNILAPTDLILDSPFMAYARASYTGFDNWSNSLASPIFSSLSSLPPTLILCGTKDPLVDQAYSFADRAAKLGCNQIHSAFYEGMPHGFYLFPHLFEEEKDCYQKISEFVSQLTR